jgi:tetratricopeptide (TPR) repeat protein
MTQSNPLAANIEAAVAQHRAGRLVEALALYDIILRAQPALAQIHRNRGEVLHRLGRVQEALVSLDEAAHLEPGFTEAHYGRGIVLIDLGRREEALASFDRAVQLKPDHLNAHIYRGILLKDMKRSDEAFQAYDTALKINPRSALTLTNKGNLLAELGHYDEAFVLFDQVLALLPDFAHAHYSKGNCLRLQQRPDDAMAWLDRAIALNPQFPEAYNSRALALQAMGRFDEALDNFDRALAVKPDFAEGHWNKSLCLLLLGRFAEGWALYESRRENFGAANFPDYPRPRWRGEDIKGKTLLLHLVLGLGYPFQFFRYALLAADNGARVIFRAHDELVRLLKDAQSGVDVIPSTAPFPAFDVYSPLLSLPMIFGADATHVPATGPYLKAEAERVAKWRTRIGENGFKVGICWQGNRQASIDTGRSFALSYFESLSKIPGVRLISLQKGDGTEQLRALPPGMKVETLGDDFDAGPDAFVDSAAVMENLDLVITSDTAMAHLAGALARPVWVALRHVPDWRWGTAGSTSPWYPSMTLFRQTKRDDWAGVFAEMAAQLQVKVAEP